MYYLVKINYNLVNSLINEFVYSSNMMNVLVVLSVVVKVNYLLCDILFDEFDVKWCYDVFVMDKWFVL